MGQRQVSPANSMIVWFLSSALGWSASWLLLRGVFFSSLFEGLTNRLPFPHTLSLAISLLTPGLIGGMVTGYGQARALRQRGVDSQGWFLWKTVSWGVAWAAFQLLIALCFAALTLVTMISDSDNGGGVRAPFWPFSIAVGLIVGTLAAATMWVRSRRRAAPIYKGRVASWWMTQAGGWALATLLTCFLTSDFGYVFAFPRPEIWSTAPSALIQGFPRRINPCPLHRGDVYFEHAGLVRPCPVGKNSFLT